MCNCNNNYNPLSGLSLTKEEEEKKAQETLEKVYDEEWLKERPAMIETLNDIITHPLSFSMDKTLARFKQHTLTVAKNAHISTCVEAGKSYLYENKGKIALGIIAVAYGAKKLCGR